MSKIEGSITVEIGTKLHVTLMTAYDNNKTISINDGKIKFKGQIVDVNSFDNGHGMVTTFDFIEA